MHNNHFVAQNVSVVKKIIPNNTTPTFQERGGVTQPAYFVDGVRTSHSIA